MTGGERSGELRRSTIYKRPVTIVIIEAISPMFVLIVFRVAQRLLAMAAAIWFNRRLDQPVKRSLIAYDH